MSVDLAVLDINPEQYAAWPVLLARLRIESPGPDPVHAVALRVQVQTEPGRRSHTQEEGPALSDLFGTRDRWAITVHRFVWLQCATRVQGFTGTTEVDLPMSCTYDVDVTASKYLNVTLHCLLCGEDTTLSVDLLLLCRACGGNQVSLTSGEELLVTSLDLAQA